MNNRDNRLIKYFRDEPKDIIGVYDKLLMVLDGRIKHLSLIRREIEEIRQSTLDTTL